MEESILILEVMCACKKVPPIMKNKLEGEEAGFIFVGTRISAPNLGYTVKTFLGNGSVNVTDRSCNCLGGS